MKKSKFYLLVILASLCLMPDAAFAQSLTVEGTVTDETGIDVTMQPDQKNLEEVVVIAYGQQKKVTITGAVSQVGGDELLKAPVASVANALQGKLPGMSVVQPSGMPGADEPVIRVRGTGSLNSAEPLVLVDGVERPFGQLDPNEIADISILKDASATAVFGVRGANGVILVTTKRGTPGKASVTVSASAAVQQIAKCEPVARFGQHRRLHALCRHRYPLQSGCDGTFPHRRHAYDIPQYRLD